MKQGFWDLIKKYEAVLLKRALARAKGDVTVAAKLLRISRPTLTTKMNEHGLGK